jgi:hypothetical protein
MFVDPEGEFFVAAIFMGAYQASRAYSMGEDGVGIARNFAAGFTSSALGTLFAPLGNTAAWGGSQNIAMGAIEGSITASANALIRGANKNGVLNSLKIGAMTGAGWGLVTSQQFQNLLQGEGWVSDNLIWQRYVQSDEINAGLKKFDLPGTYDPNQFNRSEPSMTDVNGNIYYNDTAIGHIDRIRALAAKESFHQHRYNSNSLLFQKAKHFRAAPEEALGFRELYYKQGHFPNSQIKPLPNIRLYEVQIKESFINAGKYSIFETNWWDWYYKIPRRY